MISVIPSEIFHVYDLARTMRDQERDTAIKLGINPTSSLRDCYKKSIYGRTALYNGKVAAMWGVRGIYLGNVGNPWLMVGKNADCASIFRFISLFGEELYKMLDIFPILEDWANVEHKKSVKLLKMFGFQFPDPPIQRGTALFQRAVKNA